MNLINNLYAPKNRLTDGNIKVKAYLFSMPPIQSCLNHKSCFKSCYATKSYTQYPNVKKLWNDNFNLAQNELNHLYSDLKNQCLKISTQKKHKRVIRIHQSGDFISVEYINLWAKLANEFSNILFYSYTKVLNHSKPFYKAISELNTLKNVNIISSLIGNTQKKNYGSKKYALRVAKDTGAKLCPVNSDNDNQNIHCGLERDKRYNKTNATYCDHCIKQSKVVFIQH
jgi:hypothetical protein